MNHSYLLKTTFIVFLMCSFYLSVHAVSIGTHVQANALAIQSGDGKLVAAGIAFIDNKNNVMLARYDDADGSLDATFGTNGVVTTLIGSNAQANALVIDGSGNFVVAGESDGALMVARYTSTGAIDTTFGSPNGYVTTVIGNYAQGLAVAIDGSGNIVVAGKVLEDGKAKIVLVRYTSTGVLDAGFGTGGVVKTELGTRAIAQAIALQTDGKIVVGGWSNVSGSEHFCVVRYNDTDGSLDTGFDTNGVVTTAIGSSSNIFALIIQTDGKIVAAGSSEKKLALARYTTAGSLDAGFDTDGVVTTGIGNFARVYALALQADGKIVVSGKARLDGNASKGGSILAARYTTSGALDSAFGTNGIVTLTIGNYSHSSALSIQADGNIVIAGHTDDDTALVRLDSAGLGDASFGDGGVITDPGGTDTPGLTYVWDQKAAGTAGGTFTAGAWQQRDLNKIIGKQGNVILAANGITLKPGVYEIFIQAPAHAVDNHKIQLRNATDLYTEKVGTNTKASSLEEVTTVSTLQHILYVSKPTEYRVQHRCNTTRADDGFGQAMSLGVAPEIYTQVKIQQIS